MGREIFGESSTVVQEKRNWECSAFGCFLPGGLSPAFGDGARYYCRFHYGREPMQNDEITTILKRYRSIFDGIYALRMPSDVLKIANQFSQSGRDDLSPKKDEIDFPEFYKQRLLMIIGKEIFDEIKA